MEVTLSGRVFTFPARCACCGRHPDASLEAASTRVTGKRVVRTKTRGWDIPYCLGCLQHVDAVPGSWGCGTMLLVLATGLLWVPVQLMIDASARKRAEEMCSPSCTSVGPAVSYLGWDGSIHRFWVLSPGYAADFALANRSKLLNVGPELRALVQQAAYQQEQQVKAMEVHKSREDDERLLTQTLERIEKARGPAGRRSALQRGLDKVTSQEVRQRMLLSASKIDVRATLDKVNALKSKAAKRRHLTEAIERLTSDQVPDALQLAELEVLRESLAELEG